MTDDICSFSLSSCVFHVYLFIIGQNTLHYNNNNTTTTTTAAAAASTLGTCVVFYVVKTTKGRPTFGGTIFVQLPYPTPVEANLS